MFRSPVSNSKRLLRLGFILIFFHFMAVNWAHAVSATGRVVATVLSSFSLEPEAALSFPTALPGAPDEVIEAGPASKAGSFIVGGEAGRAYSIRLPSEISLVNGPGGKDATIVVSKFNSSPSGIGLTSRDGSQRVYVGATRKALSQSQKTGLYAGSFTIEVIY